LESLKTATPVDWQGEVFGNTGISKSNNLSIVGGTNKLAYNFGVTTNDDQAVVKNSSLKRGIITGRLDYTPTQKLKISLSTRYNYQEVMGAGVSSESEDANHPALFYILSAPAHHAYPAAICTKQNAQPVELGAAATSNKRTVYKYIHLEGIKSCQLVMGLTVLEEGSVWNSVPPHIHTRRMEVYFYFDLSAEHRIFHFMGEPCATKHIVMANHEATISAPWSTHFGCGTCHYGFIWGMAGENLVYTDMDPAPIHTLA
jgi:5-keto 4-deoxyuronate isomerase